jgi:hypothetical protein
LESLETSFHQDLNGDGTIGIPAASAPVSNTASVSVAMTDAFAFRSDLGARTLGVSQTAEKSHYLDLQETHGEHGMAFLNDAQMSQLHLELPANNSDVTPIDPVNHDNMPMHSNLLGLHSGYFIFH